MSYVKQAALGYHFYKSIKQMKKVLNKPYNKMFKIKPGVRTQKCFIVNIYILMIRCEVNL